MNIILSVVIIEYHSIQEIKGCVSHLKTHIQLPYEIIVSSNSCYDEQQKAQIETHEEHVRWLFNKKNEGFAGGMDEGLRAAKGKYLIIMNSDCLIQSPLDSMISFMDEHPEVGAIAPQITDHQGNIQDTARPYVTLPRYIIRQTKRIIGHKTSILNNKMDYSKIQTVDWVIGAFIMVSRKAYEATNGLDSNYFMYAEDLDWCTRIRQQGFEIVYFPDAKVTFKGSRRARNNSKYAKIFICSHIKYWKKFGFFFGHPKRKNISFNVTEA